MVLPVRSKVGSIQATRPEKNSFTLLPVKRSTKLEHSKHKSLSCVMLRHGRSNVLMRSTGEHRKDLPRRIRPPWPLRLPTRWRLLPIECPPMQTAALKQRSSTLRLLGTRSEQWQDRLKRVSPIWTSTE